VVNPGPSPLVWWTRAATVASRDPGKGSVSAGPSCGAPDAWPDEDAQAPTEEDGAAGDIPASRARRAAKSAGGDDGSRSPFVDGPASEATGEVGRGAGGARGRGVKGATQTNLNYLPEHATDFVFASLAEQRGFFGANPAAGAPPGGRIRRMAVGSS